MIHELQQVFRSIIKSLEVLYVAEDAKPCARILVFEDEMEKAIAFLNKNNIICSISDFKVLKQAQQSEFYSDKSVKIPADDQRKGLFIIYLSKNRETAENAKTAESKSDHVGLGLLLGYPKCCCDFFNSNFDGKNTDLTLKSLEGSEGHEFEFCTNIAARHFDVSLLSHFPHNFSCAESIEIAKKNLRIISKHSEQLAAMFEGILQSTAIYTMEEGIFLLRKFERFGDMIIYGDVLTTSKSKLYFLLASNKQLKVTGKNGFMVSDVSIKGPKYGIMVFT